MALLVFEHQMHMMNLITRVGWEIREALQEDGKVDADLLQETVAEFVDYLLFIDEPPLTASVRGTSGFSEKFAAIGPRDGKGRSLRQFGFVIWFLVRYLVAGLYTVAQNERAVKTSFGRAERDCRDPA